jgi:hypothetical protein
MTGTTRERKIALPIIGRCGDEFYLSLFTNGEGDERYSMSPAMFWHFAGIVNEAAAREAQQQGQEIQPRALG